MGGKEKLLGVQYLRAVAALMVAYYHLKGQIPGFSSYLTFPGSGRLSNGVGIFFVISGFIMYLTGRNLPAGTFAFRRLVRIVPLYWVMTLSVCAIAFLAPNILHRTDVSFTYVWKSLLFVPYHSPTQPGHFYPILVPGWSLNAEMAFYALFAVALLTASRWRMWIVIGVLVICSLITLVQPGPGHPYVWEFYTSTTPLLFAVGICLGMVYTQLRLPRWGCIALAALGFLALLAPFKAAEGLAYNLGSAAIVSGVILWECQYGLLRSRVALLLGDASYSIYLVHLFAFGAMRAVWKHVPLHGAIAAWLFATFSMLAAVALALLTYQLIERTTLRWIANPLGSRCSDLTPQPGENP